QVDLEMLDGLGCQRDHPCSVAFAGQRYTSGLSEHEVLERETGEFADSGGGVVEQDQQHPIAPGFRRGACMSGQDGSGFGFGEIFHGLAWRYWWAQAFG